MREKRYSKNMKGTQGKEEEIEGERGNKGSFCRSSSRIEGNGKRELYNGF
jgi:hypothetical protein